MEFLNDLNEAQREAVTSLEGPYLVIAGAGSGKTRVLTYRLAFILSQGLADPQELLALTFTNKAAAEMKERIYRLIGADARSIVMGTFHSIFSRILRVEAERIGYTRNYTIYDADDAQKQIRDLLREQKLDDKIFKPRVISHAISMAKNRLVTPQEYREFATDDFNLKVAELYGLYELRLFKANAMDFDDLIIKPIRMFEAHPDLLYKYQRRFRYLMVDEYQDTNDAQYTLTKMLAASHQNICVVGDDAQSIYSFRGANIQNILNLKKDYPDLVILKLEENYRSTQMIVEAANKIIERNKDQIPKKVFTRNPSGDPISLVEAMTEQDEARRISDLIREQKQLHSYFNRDFAILYRTNAQSRALEDELRRAGVTYRVFGGLSFYQRKEIKDTVAYLRLAINPQDEQALLRVINYPVRGIGQTSIDRLTVFADEQKLDFWQTLLQAGQTGIQRGIASKIQDFVTMVQAFGVAARAQPAYAAASYIVKTSGILKDLHSDATQEGKARWENVQELLNAVQAFADDPANAERASLENFLAEISLFTDQDQKAEGEDYVTLMTIHSAKGLEFKSVFIVGLEENLFPNALSVESRADLEEERRLFYVAVTRARERLSLSHARSRYRFGSLQYNDPSRFLHEIDPQFLRRVGGPSRREVISPGGSPLAPSRRGMRPAVEAPAEEPLDAADPAQIAPGMRVMHQKFGKGEVISIEGQANDRKAAIFFRESGRKVLLLKYARLQILE